MFAARNTRILAISVDDREHAHDVWKKVVGKKFAVLSDPEAKVVRRYGLLHPSGHKGADIAIRATIVLDERGREQWRRVSQTVGDIPSADEVIAHLDRTAKP